MNDTSSGESRLDEPREAATRQVAASDWNRADIETAPQPTRRRERLFSRKVMIGWALFAIAAYFGVQAATTAVKASVREAVRSGVLSSATQTKDRIVIETPDGKRVTISRKRPGPSVEIVRTQPTTPTRPTDPTTRTKPTTPTTTEGGAARVDPPPSAVPPERKKR
ncbi:MAG: hypothetical protein M3O61_10690 [Gemmatimonadota bacterium]|nr:hypothetical protein [Gemmatimonadota bacterium]